MRTNEFGPQPPSGHPRLAAVAAVAAVTLGAAAFYPRPKPAPKPAAAPNVVRVERPVVVEKVVTVERLVEVSKSAPPKPVPPPVKPPPPPQWAGLWVGANGKVTIRLAEAGRGVTGFYSPHNATMKPGDVERAAADGDTLTFSVQLGDLRHGVRMTRIGDVAEVVKWVDADGIKAAYDLAERQVRGRRLSPAEVARVQQVLRELKALMKTAGPQHGHSLGTFTREDAGGAGPRSGRP